MKKVLIGIAAVIVLFIILFLVIACKEYMEVNAIDKTPVNISEVEDGVYEGYSETSLVKVRARVTVTDGKIENIEILEHQCGKGKPANAIAEEIARRNDIEVDAVSGATVSSEVIKDAVRNALREGK